jgi:hypothetical protein
MIKSTDAAFLNNMLRDLINDSSSSGSSIAHTLKQVFEANKQDAFAKHLKVFIVKKESEIEELCSAHYQEFVGSVDQLLKVRQETVALKDSIESLNRIMGESGSDLISRRKEIIGLKRVAVNCDQAIKAVKKCMNVLEISTQIRAQVDVGKYYSALRVRATILI